MILLVLALIGSLIFYLWFLKPLVFYFRAVLAFGWDGVILIYQPFTNHLKYMRHLNAVHGDSFAEIKRKIAQKPEAKIIIFGYLFHCLQNVIDPSFIRRITGEFIHHHEKMKFLFGDQYDKNLVFSNDKVWKNSRRIISNIFHFETIKSQEPIIDATVEEEINGLDKMGEVNLYDLSCRITGKVVIRLMVGMEFQKMMFGELNALEEAVQINKLFVIYSAMPVNIVRFMMLGKLTPPEFLQMDHEKELHRRLEEFKRKGREYLEKELVKIKNGGVSSSGFIEVFMKEANPEEYFDEIIEQCLIFLFAGQDTTANLIESCLTFLAQYPEHQERIRQEHKEKNCIHTLKSLENFIQETNRLAGPVRTTLIRKITTPFTLDGYTFKKGSFMTAGLGLTMFNPKYFDNPNEFLPERWDKMNEDTYAFIPFSSGARNCIGQHLAKVEVRYTLIEILKKYRLERTDVPVSFLALGNIFYGKLHHNLVKFIPIEA